MLAVRARPQRHPRPLRGVHERVVEQRPADLEHAQLVRARDRPAFDLDVDRMAPQLGDHAKLLRDRLSDFPEIDGLVLDVHPARVEPREVEQIGRELGEPVDLLAHRLEKLPPRLLVELLVHHQLEEAAEREEGRAQLVRGVGDELAPGSIEVLQANAHPLERGRQLSELVVAGVDDRLVELPDGDPLGGTLEPGDPACVHRGERIAGNRSEQQADQAGDEQLPLDEIDAGERVRRRRSHEEDTARLVVRNCRLGELAAAAVHGPALALARLDRAQCDRVALDVEGRPRVRVAEDQQALLEQGVDDDARLDHGCAGLGVDLLGEASEIVLVAPRQRGRVVFELVELGAHELGLERGHDDQVDDTERAGDHEQQRQRQPQPDAPDRGAHHQRSRNR